jgi:hypothetical protein
MCRAEAVSGCELERRIGKFEQELEELHAEAEIECIRHRIFPELAVERIRFRRLVRAATIDWGGIQDVWQFGYVVHSCMIRDSAVAIRSPRMCRIRLVDVEPPRNLDTRDTASAVTICPKHFILECSVDNSLEVVKEATVWLFDQLVVAVSCRSKDLVANTGKLVD